MMTLEFVHNSTHNMYRKLPSCSRSSCRICKKRIMTRFNFSVLGGLLILLTIRVDPGLGLQAVAASIVQVEQPFGCGCHRVRSASSASRAVPCIHHWLPTSGQQQSRPEAPHFDELTSDGTAWNILRAEACLSVCWVLASWAILTIIYNPSNVVTSIICIGQSKFVMVPTNEDSHEHILNCIQQNELEATPLFMKISWRTSKLREPRCLVLRRSNFNRL